MKRVQSVKLSWSVVFKLRYHLKFSCVNYAQRENFPDISLALQLFHEPKNTLKLFDPKPSSQPLKKLTAMLAKRGKNTLFWTLFTPSSLKLLK